MILTNPSKARNQHVDQIKEVIANTENNIAKTEEILASVAMSDLTRNNLQSTNTRREHSILESKEALEDEFTHS
ncbi:MAG: hypothetical protein OWR52_08260 [Acidibacillus sp.]|uniref:Uncharacterized protein n=1 Tax=Sulfoacidibacillus ferrooxidans TaxID=2005001 RepID=A0A9X1V805_9BACL|nr:hypothetical protein [Sulfoacidibacillus ferrooxidans]MCY0893484.1 hypothetical protein [Acidibacillus sp.]